MSLLPEWREQPEEVQGARRLIVKPTCFFYPKTQL